MVSREQTVHVVICDEWAEVWCRGAKICQRACVRDALRVAADILSITHVSPALANQPDNDNGEAP